MKRPGGTSVTVAALPAVAEYVEDGVTLSFPAPFRFKSQTDLIVERVRFDGTVVTLALGTDYTVTGGSTDAGGTVIRTAAGSGAKLRIRRQTARSQTMAYPTGGRFPAESHEAALDRQMLIAQEQDADQADITTRALLVPAGEASVNLPIAGDRAGAALVFDEDGQPIAKPIGSFPIGPTGPANSTYPSVAGITNAPISNLSAIRADGQGGLYTYTPGDFTGQVDNNLVIASGQVPITTGAWALTTSQYVAAWSMFSQIIVPQAYTRVVSGGFYSQGVQARPAGGANYRLDTDQTSTTTNAWRKRSRNGRWFVLDEPAPNLHQLGLRAASNLDQSDALEAAFAYMTGTSGRLLIPKDVFFYDRNIRCNYGGFTMEGVSQEGRLAPRNSSRLIFGYIDPVNGEGSGNKSIKCYRPTLRNFSIKPDANHDGPIVVLEFVDEVTVDHMDIGPYQMDGGTNPAFCIGILVWWVQFFTMRKTIINTNGYCVRFLLDNNNVPHNENEDHYLIDEKCMLYIGKRPPNGTTPACINVQHTFRRSRFGGIQNLEIKSAHFYQNADGQGANASRCVLWTTDFTDGRVRSFHNLRITGGFWENMTFGLDSASAMGGTAQSQMSATLMGIGHIQCGQGSGALINGGGRDVAQVYVEGCSWTQVGRLVRAALVTFGAGNKNYGVNIAYDGPLSDMRFVNKESGDVNGVGYLAGRRLATIAAGQTSVTFNHGLGGIGGDITPNWVNAAVIGPTPYSLAASISGQTVTVTSETAAPAGGIRCAVNVELLDS